MSGDEGFAPLAAAAAAGPESAAPRKPAAAGPEAPEPNPAARPPDMSDEVTCNFFSTRRHITSSTEPRAMQ